MKIHDIQKQMKYAEQEIRGKKQAVIDTASHYGKLSFLTVVFTFWGMVFGALALNSYLDLKEIGDPVRLEDTSTSQVIEAPQAPEEPTETTPEAKQEPILATFTAKNDGSHYSNFPRAVTALRECQERLPDLYNNWVGWYGKESAVRMCAIIKAENGRHDPKVVATNKDKNKSKDVGIFQINTFWHCEKLGYKRHLHEGNQRYHGELNACIVQLQDVNTNINVARQIYEASGWSPWYGRRAYLPEFWADRLTI